MAVNAASAYSVGGGAGDLRSDSFGDGTLDTPRCGSESPPRNGEKNQGPTQNARNNSGFGF